MEPTPPAYTASTSSSSAAPDSRAHPDAGASEKPLGASEKPSAAAPAYDSTAPAYEGPAPTYDGGGARFHIQADDIAAGYRRQLVVAAGATQAAFAAKHHGQHTTLAPGAAADDVTLYAGAGPGRSGGDDAPVLAAARLHGALAAGVGRVRVFAGGGGGARVRIDAHGDAYTWEAGGRRWTWRAAAHAAEETPHGWVDSAEGAKDADADAGVLARLRRRVHAPPLHRLRYLTAALSVDGDAPVARFAELLPRAAARPGAPPVYDGGHAGELEFAGALARNEQLAALLVLMLVLEQRRRRAMGRQGGFRDAFGAGWYMTG